MIPLFTSLLAITLAAGTSLVYGTIGEIFTERSGILNLGVEGMMITGAVTAFATVYHTGSLLTALLMAMLAGMILGGIHAFLSVTMRANQVVSGLAVTLFGTGFASFLGQRLGPAGNNYSLTGLSAERFHRIAIPGLSEIPIVGAVFHQDVLTYLVYLLIPATWFFMYKTRYGLAIRACGESPQTADAMGVNVHKLRYLYTILGGMLVGLGGAHLSLSYTPGWTENITGGRGWIVIALVIFSMWNPSRAIWGAIIFGGINAVQFRMQAAGTDIPSSFLNMAPYIATVLVLVIMTVWERHNKRVGPPSALGVPYMREEK